MPRWRFRCGAGTPAGLLDSRGPSIRKEIRLRVAVPWGLSRYMPLNGFHPLYQPLFDANPRLEFSAVDLPALARALRHSPWFAAECARRSQSLARELMNAAPDLDLLAAFIGNITPEELWAASDLPGDIELHHTSPNTAGLRPFVLHCESFLPVFFPFFQQGAGGLEDHAGVRQLFRSILGSPACIAILSHIPGTLSEISSFFGDAAIDARLGQTRVGISERNLRRLLAAPRDVVAREPVFLFTNSAHQNPNSIPLRGGIAVLRFAERYLRAGHAGRFVFRTTRPAESMLRDWGVDAGYLRAHENGRVQWLESYLDEDSQLDLFAAADVLLLPSANLHSVSLMQALAAGAIPVVTDTHGTERFVEDGDTGVVLTGVRSRIWATHAPSGVRYDRHEAFAGAAGDLVEQLFGKLLPLLANADAVAAMRERMRRAARDRFSGDAYRDALSEDLEARWRVHGGGAARALQPSLLQRFGAVSSGGWERYFSSPPVPRRQGEVEGGLRYAGGGVQYRVLGGRLQGLDQWSPFRLHRQGRLRPDATTLFGDLKALEEDASTSAAARLASGLRARLHFARLRRMSAD